MRHQELETSAHHELRRIVRSVDKRLSLQIQDGPTPQDPFVMLALSQSAQQVTMEVSVEEVRRAMENDRERSHLRQRVRRARERLWHPARPERFFSTKAIRPGSESFAHFRGGRR